MTYEDAKPFVEKLRDLATFYHAKPNELQRRLYETLDEIEKSLAHPTEFGDTSAAYMVGVQDGIKAEREACAKVCEEQYEYYGHDHVFAKAIRARSNT